MSLFTRKELSKYSLTKALSELSSGIAPGEDGDVTGLEEEASQAIKSHVRRTTGSEPLGFQIPIRVLAPIKAQNVTTATAGGFLVDESLDSIAAALRPASVVLSLGASSFSNLNGNFALPAETSFPAAAWLAETEALADPSDAVYSKTVLTPRRCASIAVLSQQLLSQNSLGVENFVRTSLGSTLGSALDKGALSGAGGKEPLGLINNPSVSTITFSATPTRAKLISMQDTLTTANAGNLDQSALAYVSTPASASKLMQTSQVSGQARFLWEGNEWSGNVAGLPARSTTNAGSGNLMICGDWSKLVVAYWSEGFSIMTDPFTQKKTGIVEVFATLLADVAPLNAANFVVSTDSAAQ
jgi:HK97 family phage major capsid protein